MAALAIPLVIYLVHRIVAHRAVVIRLRAVVAAVNAHTVAGHVLGSTGRRRRHHRRRCALARAAHTIRRGSCKSCCRNNRGAYKFSRMCFYFAYVCVCQTSSFNQERRLCRPLRRKERYVRFKQPFLNWIIS
jgi:fatty-acid desaturase